MNNFVKTALFASLTVALVMALGGNMQPAEAEKFATIRDSFENLDNWELEAVVLPENYPRGFNNYTASIDTQQGNSAPSALISGDGFVSQSALTRTIPLNNLDGDLFLGVDYRAISDVTGSSVTNAVLNITDSQDNTLYVEPLNLGGTTDTKWQSFSKNITDIVKGHNAITVKLYLGDSWAVNHHQKAYFDNFYLGTTDPTPPPNPPLQFTTIRDSFENLNSWDLVNVVLPKDYPRAYNNYTASITGQAGNPSPSVIIDGEGFKSTSFLTRTISLDNLNDDHLFLGVDYRAVSDNPILSGPSALFIISDLQDNILYSKHNQHLGMTDSNWQTFNKDITGIVDGHDSIVVKLALRDAQLAKAHDERVYFDNFYLGTVEEPDTTAPVLTVPDDVTFEATAVKTPLTTEQLGTATAIDNMDPNPKVTSNATATFALGTTTILYTATDGTGNTSTDTQVITIRDITAPVFDYMPEDIESSSSRVFYTMPTATDIFPVTIQCSPDSGSTFDVGTTEVTCTAEDTNSNTSTVSFNVTVLPPDTTPPVILGNPTLDETDGVLTITFDEAIDVDAIDELGFYIYESDYSSDDPSAGTRLYDSQLSTPDDTTIQFILAEPIRQIAVTLSMPTLDIETDSVYDTSGNGIAQVDEQELDVTGTDSIPPFIIDRPALNKDTGVLTVTFNEIINVSQTVPALIHIREVNEDSGGITLSDEELVRTHDGTTVQFRLTEPNRIQVAAMNTPALSADAYAFSDISGNGILPVTYQQIYIIPDDNPHP